MSSASRVKKYTDLCREYLLFLEDGIKPRLALTMIRKRGYDRGLTTLYNQIETLKRTGYALSTAKIVRRKAALDESQMDFLHDWVLEKNTNHEYFQRSDVQRMIFDKWAIEVSLTTCGKLLRKLNFTIKECREKTGGNRKSNAVLKALYWKFIQKMQKRRRFGGPPSRIRSIDVTYTRRPAKNRHTYSLKGSGPQMASEMAHPYTDAIVTCISADGLNHTPCMMFTNNLKMAPLEKNTPGKVKNRAAFDEKLVRYGISPDRVVYVKSDRKYCGESWEMYEQFIKHYDIPTDVTFLHDGGNAFTRKGVTIFESLGYKFAEEYENDVHQYLSPNDNKLHGCKATWTAEYYKFKDDVSPSLRLMQLIDLDTVKNSKGYFHKNLLYVKKSDLNHIIGL